MSATPVTVAPVDGRPAGTGGGRLGGLDAVRGVAVLVVVLGHAGVPGLGAGAMAGVHLFFVLSGFLITGLLLREFRTTGRIDLPAFWARRALRLLPALWVFVAASIALYSLARWDRWSELLPEALPSLLYYANFVPRADLGIFTHTWSLAVEEQFYVTWPLVLLPLLLLLRRRTGRARAAGLLTGTLLLLAVSLAWRLIDGDEATVPSLPHTTAFALLAGAALAVVHEAGWRPPARGRLPVALAAGAVLLWGGRPAGALGLPDDWVHLAVLQVAAATVLVAAAAGLDGRPGTPLRALGVVSYGWYLWHYPLLVAAERGHLGLPSAPARGVMVVVSLAVAVLSWHVLEKPLLRRYRPRLERSRLT